MSRLISLLHEDEGLRLFVYDDHNGAPIEAGYTCIGNPTIGYGRLLTKGRGISQGEADALFSVDLQNTLEELEANFDWFSGLESVRADVVICMAFNMGVPTFSEFKNTIHAIKRGYWDMAADEILDSKAARQLPERYENLSNMMRTGEY